MESLRGHRDGVYSVAFTPDARGLVSGSLDKTLKYWDVSRLVGGPDDRPTSFRASKRDSLDGEQKVGCNHPCTMNFAGHKVGVKWDAFGCISLCYIGLRFVRRCLAGRPMGCKWIERLRSSILGCEDCGLSNDVARSQGFRSVIPYPIQPHLGHSETDSSPLPVFSVDLSPVGNIFATGSGDWQARICGSLLRSSQLAS